MNRRNFIRNAAALSALTVLKPNTVFATNSNSAVRVGVIGCGNRANGIISAMAEKSNIAITAMADLFPDRLKGFAEFANDVNRQKGHPSINQNSMYVGHDAYLRLLQNRDIDAVVIAAPGYARPQMIKDAVEAEKHIYAEKPMAVDAMGCQEIVRVAKNIKGRVSVFNGFQIRYATPYVEMAKRIKRGDIGEVVTVQLYYFSSGSAIIPCDGASYDEMRIRNHYYFHEISGGCYLDQAIHMIDTCNWILDSKPLFAFGTGNRKGTPGLGNAWTNYQVIYAYPNDINVSVHSSKFGDTFGGVCARFIGTDGVAEAHYSGGVFINGKNVWDSGILRSTSELTPESIAQGAKTSSLYDADINKMEAFINSIVNGQYENQLEWGCDSTLSAIMGREAASTREKVTWDELVYTPQRIDPNLDMKQFTNNK